MPKKNPANFKVGDKANRSPVKKKTVKKAEKAKKKVMTQIARGKYRFTEEEKRDMAKQLAETQINKSIIENEKASSAAGYNDRLKRFDFDISRLSRNVVDGYEMRDFECRVVKDFVVRKKGFVDVHTGNTIDERPLDPSDYQKELDI